MKGLTPFKLGHFHGVIQFGSIVVMVTVVLLCMKSNIITYVDAAPIS